MEGRRALRREVRGRGREKEKSPAFITARLGCKSQDDQPC
jgi:hypothetical protein